MGASHARGGPLPLDSNARCGLGGEAQLGEEMLALLRKIDADGSGTVSELELIAAVQRHPEVAAVVLPGMDAGKLMSDERCFDAIDEIFEKMAGGRRRVKYCEFAAHFRRPADTSPKALELRRLYDLIDADCSGCVSKLELFDAVERNPDVAQLVLPSAHSGRVLGDEEAFDVVKRVFDAIAGGKKRFEYRDFEKHFCHALYAKVSVETTPMNRSSKRVLIIGPGFGRGLNPRQGDIIEQAGYQFVHWCWDGLPNPEVPNFAVQPYLPIIKKAIDEVQPHVIACASKGGPYLVGLWAAGCWGGPSLLINAHPMLQKLPEGVPIVLCQGSNDEVYPTPRSRLEELVSTGTDNRCFLYHTANSGQLSTGQFSRVGDRHNMQSILEHDCLPRLLDAAMSPDGPELHFLRTWRERLTTERLNAERWLGYSPELLRTHWSSPGHAGCAEEKLWEVPRDSEEFANVEAIFKASPLERPAYLLLPQATWEIMQIVKLERIENGALHEGCTKPYYASIERSVEEQGVAFEPGVHTCWAFHGADADAIDSIVTNPINGFQPLACGSRGASLWGSGTYFARDAKYVADGGFCGQPAPDGTRKMLMCLLTTGMPCLGDPLHRGVLPFRRHPHRYHSSVDSLSSPEIFNIQHPGAAHASYLITFA